MVLDREEKVQPRSARAPTRLSVYVNGTFNHPLRENQSNRAFATSNSCCGLNQRALLYLLVSRINRSKNFTLVENTLFFLLSGGHEVNK